MKNILNYLIVYAAITLGFFNAHVKLAAWHLLHAGKAPRIGWVAALARGSLSYPKAVIAEARNWKRKGVRHG